MKGSRFQAEKGLSLIEIVVSMFLLALLALAFLPMIIQSLTLTRSNTTLATASQLVNRELDLARSQAPTCAGLTSFAAAVVPVTTDQRGVALQPQRSVTCPASYPGTARFTSTVVISGTTTAVSSSVTLIFVSAAS
ncbi:hypothetical protein BH09ACT3_BH09ACT3_06760 [soil metagenome]